MRSKLTQEACLLTVLLVLSVLGSPKQAKATTEEADLLYRDAVEKIGTVSAEASIEAFENVLKADRKFAPAYYEMAKLRISLHTIRDRYRAEKALADPTQRHVKGKAVLVPAAR